jgi:transcription initiation factor TFIID TATA-box-binding protein
LRLADPKLTLLLFKNGKVICAGAKREDLLRKGLKKANDLVAEVNKNVKGDDFDEEEEEEEKPAKKAKK